MADLAQARQLLRDGRIAEAERAYEQVLRTAPAETEALNFLGLAALRRQDRSAALEFLRRAVAAAPADGQSHYHLGRALDESGQLADAQAAYQAATELQPDLHAARLHLAHTFDRLGEQAPALRSYTDALARAQLAGRWLDPATTPQNLRPLVERAVHRILAAKREIVDRVLTSLTQRYGAAELARVVRALRVFLREDQARPPDARQQPTMLYFPDIPSLTYFDTATMPWVAGMEAQFPAIRAELLAALQGRSITERVFLDADVERVNLRGLDVAPSWTGYYFYRHGARREDHCAACPATAAAIDAAPLARVPGHGPEVLYSVFTPGTHLLPHRGVTNARLVAHLPLVIPEDCALNVGGELHHWREGKVVVFDDTYEHEAWNRSDRTRVVMIFDVWNPFLTEVERQALADVLAEMTALQPAAAH